ncbi:hypothetical protein DPMN_061541 [Dreissena polymorpha]|uniref:Uncharacterized protein n=1 Tax=Dreissena polymorpha TaxID=45954 RepID=A0A9D4C7N1_DREPO|nr:hypothetical protein DPMN_061541 [Dreissena polymorpha]
MWVLRRRKLGQPDHANEKAIYNFTQNPLRTSRNTPSSSTACSPTTSTRTVCLDDTVVAELVQHVVH